jgi:hypothetical protein
MRIRWKFLIVLLSISLIPMIVMRLNGQQAMRELGNDLATQTKNALITETKVALKRLVEDHARILKRERELLEMTILLVSSEIQKRLYNIHDNSPLESAPSFPTQTIPLYEHNDKEMYCLLKPQGQCLPLQMSFMNQRFYIKTCLTPPMMKFWICHTSINLYVTFKSCDKKQTSRAYHLAIYLLGKRTTHDLSRSRTFFR